MRSDQGKKLKSHLSSLRDLKWASPLKNNVKLSLKYIVKFSSKRAVFLRLLRRGFLYSITRWRKWCSAPSKEFFVFNYVKIQKKFFTPSFQ